MECEMNGCPSTTTSSHKRDVAGDARHAAEDAALADRVLPAMADAGRHRRVRADAAVVRDHDEVVELDAVFDDGVADRAAVDGGVRADLDVVTDGHAADLRHLDPGALLGREAEAIARR